MCIFARDSGFLYRHIYVKSLFQIVSDGIIIVQKGDRTHSNLLNDNSC